MGYGYKIGKIGVKATVGVKTCSSGVYDAFLASDTVNYSCSISTTEIDDIYNTVLWKQEKTSIFDSCAAPEAPTPAGPII